MKKEKSNNRSAPLTAKQKRFVDEYMIDFNATQAALKAGYSEKTCRQMGTENLAKPFIQAEIQRRQAEIRDSLEITQEKVLGEIASIAFANTTDYVKVLGDGVYVVPTESLSKEKQKAISAIKQTQTGIEIKTHDKIKALDLLGKRLGLWDKVEVSVGEEEKDPLTKALENIAEKLNNGG